jgi:protease IV
MTPNLTRYCFPLLRVLFLLSFVLCPGCVSIDLQSLIFPQLSEIEVQAPDRWTRNKVLIVDVSGIIVPAGDNRRFFHPKCSPDKIKAILNKAEKDSGIKGIILRIDTPGGEVTSTDMIYHEIMDFKNRTGIPVVASMMGLTCSGGYYIACSADQVFAHPTTITGSIGIIARFPKLVGLANKIGYKEEIIATGEMKAMGHPLREMTPEARAIVEKSIDSLYERFLGVIRSGRDEYKTIEQVQTIADGRIYTAQQALDLKLIDRVAYLSEAIEFTKETAGIRDAKIITYASGFTGDFNIYSQATPSYITPMKFINFDFSSLLPHGRPGFFYLWLPGQE